jgi:hypothetical protein
VKRVVHNFINRASVIYQNLKDFNSETKNIKQDLMLNEYPQHFIDSIVKPSRSNCTLGGTYHGMVLIPYVWGVSEKFKCLGITSMLAEFSELNIHSVGH